MQESCFCIAHTSRQPREKSAYGIRRAVYLTDTAEACRLTRARARECSEAEGDWDKAYFRLRARSLHIKYWTYEVPNLSRDNPISPKIKEDSWVAPRCFCVFFFLLKQSRWMWFSLASFAPYFLYRFKSEIVDRLLRCLRWFWSFNNSKALDRLLAYLSSGIRRWRQIVLFSGTEKHTENAINTNGPRHFRNSVHRKRAYRRFYLPGHVPDTQWNLNCFVHRTRAFLRKIRLILG